MQTVGDKIIDRGWYAT